MNEIQLAQELVQARPLQDLKRRESTVVPPLRRRDVLLRRLDVPLRRLDVPLRRLDVPLRRRDVLLGALRAVPSAERRDYGRQQSRRHEIANSQLQRTQSVEATDTLKRSHRDGDRRCLRSANHRRDVPRKLFGDFFNRRFFHIGRDRDSANRGGLGFDDSQHRERFGGFVVRLAQFQHDQHVGRHQFAELQRVGVGAVAAQRQLLQRQFNLLPLDE